MRSPRYWQSGHEAERWHVIGKDILRFHAVYWPAILLSAGLALPSSVRAHGFITSGGKKLGKSLGNAVDPQRLVARYGVDPLRYYLLGHLHTTKDSDFREDLLRTAYDSELAGKLGNLLQRVCALCVRHEVAIVTSELDPRLVETARSTRLAVARAIEDFALQDALRAIFELIAAANRHVDNTAPWQLAEQTKSAGSCEERLRAAQALSRALSSDVHALTVSAELLAPFLPETARAIRARLEPKPSLGEPLFPRLKPA